MGGPITLPTCCFFCVLDSSAAAFVAPTPPALKFGSKSLPLLFWPFIIGSKEHAMQTPLCFSVFSLLQLWIFFQEGSASSPSIAPPAMYLLQKSSHSPWEHPNKLFPSSFALLLPTIFFLSHWLPLCFHLSQSDPAQEELLLSYKCFGPILIKGPVTL